MAKKAAKDKNHRNGDIATQQDIDLVTQTVRESPIIGWLDYPREGQTVTTPVVEIRGWAWSTASRITHVETLLDGGMLTTLPYGDERPDVREALPMHEIGRCGFAGEIALDPTLNGSHTVTVRVSDESGNVREFGCTIEVEQPTGEREQPTASGGIIVTDSPIIGWLDDPREGQTVTAVMGVSGWAWSTAGRITGVEAWLDEELLDTVPYGSDRPDARDALPMYEVGPCGYAGEVALAATQGGSHTVTVRVRDERGNVRQFSRTITVEPIIGALNDPIEAQTITSPVMGITGWAWSTAGRITRVEAWLDDESPAIVPYGDDRPDVRDALPMYTVGRCGYVGEIALDPSLNGSHLVTVRVEDERGNVRAFSCIAEVVLPTARIHIDAPSSETVCMGAVLISGWVVSLVSPIRTVEAFLGGHSLGPLMFGMPRPDVFASYSHLNAANSGFWSRIALPSIRAGYHVLVVRATDMRDKITEAEVIVRVGALDEPAAEIEYAVVQRNMLEVVGWAVLPSATPPRTVRVYVDGEFIGRTPLNLSRPDIRQRFPNTESAFRSGFRFRHPLNAALQHLSATNLHEVVVEIVDREGQQVQRRTHIDGDFDGPREEAASILTQLEDLIEEFRSRMGSEPTLMDWDTEYHLAAVFPQYTVFSPLVREDNAKLPYFDRTTDIVVVSSEHPAHRHEARRVAAALVVRLGNDPLDDTLSPPSSESVALHAEWIEDMLRGDDRQHTHTVWSVIIAVHNKSAYTQRCLTRLSETLPKTPSGEIIVVNDASTDDTEEILTQFASIDARIRVVQNVDNVGFLHSCNRGAEIAAGEFLVFLNNDTLPAHGWLPPLLQTFHDHSDAGAVGGKLIYPDGRLQEAGAVIFSDGTGCNFGRLDADPDAPLYNYVREVDYCSGALLATKRTLFMQMGGFDTQFAPAYYEDVDYCFQLRRQGFRVFYQPESAIVHFEGISSGTDLTTGTKRFQVVNQTKFVEKWGDALCQQPSPPLHYDYPTLCRLAVRGEGMGDDEHAS